MTSNIQQSWLRYYQELGMEDPANRSDAIHAIATNDDQVISLDDGGIDDLCGQLQEPAAHADVLASLKDDGLTIGECITALSVPNDDPFVAQARNLVFGMDDMEIDDNTTTSVGDGGPGFWPDCGSATRRPESIRNAGRRGRWCGRP